MNTRSDAKAAAELLANRIAAKKKLALVEVVETETYFAVEVDGVEQHTSFPFNRAA